MIAKKKGFISFNTSCAQYLTPLVIYQVVIFQKHSMIKQSLTMKKLKFILLTAVMILTPTLYSCLDDDDDRYSLSIGTVKVIDGKDYYFLSDKGNKILPGDTTAIHNYEVIDGQRVFVYFYPMDEVVSGYDYNAQVVSIQNILTKGVFQITEETQESIGNDPVNITYMWFGGGYLNIEFQILGTNNPKEPHLINLVRDEENPGTEEEGYVNLEFRHNAMNDEKVERLVGIVSIKEPFTDDLSKVGLNIKVNTIYNGVEYYKIEFAEAINKVYQTGIPNAYFR